MKAVGVFDSWKNTLLMGILWRDEVADKCGDTAKSAEGNVEYHCSGRLLPELKT